jgi:preprotein translocase subunit SecD
LACLVLAAAGLLVGCTQTKCSDNAACAAGKQGPQTRLRIYDPNGQAADVLTASDIVASSVRTGAEEGGVHTDFIAFELTPRGQKRFHRLTAGLAHRGASLHRLQHFAFEVNGRVYARPFIDYRISPDGFDASGGVEIAPIPPKVAKRLAAALRRGALDVPAAVAAPVLR